ncbi:MAG: FKBP-type peptidyl-prolyl cis-trans isomerase [Bacteroidota bacterium]
MRYLIFTFLLSFFLWNCQPTEQSLSEEKVILSDEESEDVLMRLSQELESNPQTRAQKERNEMLQFALDSLWNVRELPSGLWLEVAVVGEGDTLQWADRLEVDYVGYFMGGKQFDSSYDRKRTLQFYIGNMIDGWNEVLQLVKPGSQIKLLVPSRLAYGEEGLVTATGDTLVLPNQALAFKIEVIRKIQ